MPHSLHLGIDTFGDVTVDADGKLISQAQTLRHVVEEGVLADQVGLHAFGVGEHHRPDFAVSAPEVVLAAIAARTSQIRLGSAVTVLSTDDPVRVFQRFSTLNAISNGRAEVILGRGSFTESYPLFGFDLNDYDELFEERLDIFAKLLDNAPVTWSGRTRATLTNVTAYPPIESGKLTTWIGVGGSPESVVRAARHGLPLTLAIIGGSARRFLPFVELYKQSLLRFSKPMQMIAAHSPGHVAATDAQARDDVWPHYQAMMTRIGRERGWPPMAREHFEREAGPDGALYVGSPETVATKIAATVQTLGLDRFDMKYSSGTLPHDKLMTSIELFGTRVARRVRELLGPRH
ncbi:MAG TPA: LLM class flavin-dependent oxidoreductase [Vicinamibacterales bacterium]|nr:LLM class flavin-dependent oxidoreductase [Vicinamibacterales bacterium]